MMRMEGTAMIKVDTVAPGMIVHLHEDGPDVIVNEVWRQGEGLGVVLKGYTVKTGYVQVQRYLDVEEKITFVGWME